MCICPILSICYSIIITCCYFVRVNIHTKLAINCDASCSCSYISLLLLFDINIILWQNSSYENIWYVTRTAYGISYLSKIRSYVNSSHNIYGALIRYIIEHDKQNECMNNEQWLGSFVLCVHESVTTSKANQHEAEIILLAAQ